MKMTSEKNLYPREPKTKKVVKSIPPDGGWGWMVVLGTATSNIFNQSMLSVFSLLYGDTLEEMGHKMQGAAVVMSTMLFVSNFSGPIAGAIVKVSTTRFVAMIGACFCTMGIFTSAFATNIFHLTLSYGLLLGLGLGFIQNSSFVAMNSYFKARKSRAVGLANVGTGVGQTLMPHLVSYLLENYGFRGTCLLLSSLSLHGIAGTMLIQPVSWHLKKVEEEVVIDETINLLPDKKHKDIVINKKSLVNINQSRRSTEPDLLNGEKINGGTKLFKSQNDIIGSPIKMQINGIHHGPKTAQKKSLLRKISELFDLALLTSPRFINIIIGTAFAVTSVQNFSLLYPFFLQKTVHLTKKQTAMCMSAVASADIAGRLTLPILQDKYKIKARWMLIYACTWILIIRQILAYQSELMILLIMSSLYGYGRSITVVSRNLSISENCRLDQVPAAVGLGMLSMGIMVPPAGYILGWIRDYTGSYIICITAQNIMMFVLLVMWIPDMLYLKIKERRKARNDAQAPTA